MKRDKNFVVRNIIVLIALVFLVAMQPVLAHPNGTIKGQVLDLTGTGIPGAKVAVGKDDQKYEIKTDKDGNYELALPAGTYLLIVRADGFLPSRKRQIKIMAGQTTKANVTMFITRETNGCLVADPENKSEPKKEN